MVRSIAVVIAVLLAGCTSVEVKRLKADLSATEGAPGLIYYLPTPYLLVAELPPTRTESTTSGKPPAPVQNEPKADALPAPEPPPGMKPGEKSKPAPSGPPKPGPGAEPSGGTPSSDGSTKTDSTTSQTTASDLSFSGSTPQYLIKLVYLPDLSRPMAMSETSGLGTAAMKPTLQDGWMLTALDASADSKIPDTLNAVASLVGSIVGAGGGAATKTASAATAAGKKGESAPGGKPAPTELPDLSGYFGVGHFILRPGLYKFEYDASGKLTGLRAVATFTGCGALDQSAVASFLSGARGCGELPSPTK